MNSNRKAAAVAGWLYVLGFATGILSVAYAVDAPDYLLKAAANANEVMTAAFFHLVMAPVYVGIAIALYPILRQYHPHLALGFAGFRVIAGGFILTPETLTALTNDLTGLSPILLAVGLYTSKSTLSAIPRRVRNASSNPPPIPNPNNSLRSRATAPAHAGTGSCR